jgi:transporter family-2 protein
MRRPSGRAIVVLAFIGSFGSGILVALQSRINGELGVALNDGALAALVSFSMGFLIMTTAILFFRRGRTGLRTLTQGVISGQLPWWTLLGGFGGGFIVLTQGISAGVLGVALFTIAVVAGQTVGAVLIDAKGMFGMPQLPVGPLRILGALVVLVGVLVSVDITPEGLARQGIPFLLPLVAGLGFGFQQAVNSRVLRFTGSVLTATFTNFAGGTVLLSMVFLVSLLVRGEQVAMPTPWWMWTGGAVGTIFIALQASIVSVIGILGLGVGVVSGQIFGSLLLDLFAPLASTNVVFMTVLGAVITLVGSVMVTLGRRSA